MEMLVGVAFIPPSFLPSRTQAFYIIKRQNCLNICNTVYISTSEVSTQVFIYFAIILFHQQRWKTVNPSALSIDSECLVIHTYSTPNCLVESKRKYPQMGHCLKCGGSRNTPNKKIQHPVCYFRSTFYYPIITR